MAGWEAGGFTGKVELDVICITVEVYIVFTENITINAIKTYRCTVERRTGPELLHIDCMIACSNMFVSSNGFI